MSTAFRLLDLAAREAAPTMSPEPQPSPISTLRPSMRPTLGISMLARVIRPSMRPTLVPSSRSTVLPRTLVTEPPSTQRSATVHPRFEASARHEANNLVAIMRLNVQFLESLVDGSSPLTVDALTDIHRTLDRLQNRIGSWSRPE